jgi:O-antigen/teichoic acid export membrane protein
MVENTNNKTIAKNTVFLYFRMMFTMLVALYTSRVILKVLGVEDYGIYQIVGGIVGFLSFINGALSTGSSRFFTFGLGTGDNAQLRRTFSTTLTIHILLALLIVVVAETIGLWFLHHKLIIEPDRMNAAVFVFHLSVLTSVFTLTQVPYNASIIAHEKMSIYAYISIIEVSLKLAILYLLNFGNIDKLKLYATLLCIVQISLMLIYRFYCVRHFKETKYRFVFDRSIFKSIAGFSGWSLFANISIALNNQGVLILLNMFFSPAIVTARAISIQVNMAANQFVNNFRIAVNPQIVKKYASGSHEGSKQLLLSSTKYSYYLMLILSLPIFLLAKPLLNLWLTEVPEYTVIFLQLIIIQSLFQTFDTSFYTALYTKGQLRENALISPTLGFLMFPIVYLLFKAEYSPVALSWASLICYATLGLIIKPILLVKIVDYQWADILKVFIPCFWVTLISLPMPLIGSCFINTDTIGGFITLLIITLTSVSINVYFIGIDKENRNMLIKYVFRGHNPSP